MRGDRLSDLRLRMGRRFKSARWVESSPQQHRQSGIEEGSKMASLNDGDRVLIIDRKLFKDDNTRFFVGVIEEYDTVAVRVRGYPFHLSPYEISGAERHGEERLR